MLRGWMRTNAVWRCASRMWQRRRSVSEALPLVDIQKLQFKDKAQAEKYLLEFLRKCEDPKIDALELMPKPESLNSINGFIRYANGDRFFFKAHVEENEQIEEYYNSELLAGCGYPVIAAKRVKQHPGQQIAIYEILSYPTLFDIVKTEEDKILSGAISTTAPYIVQAQESLEKNVSAIYKNTCQEINAETHARAPVHQLFYHRLQEDGRVGVFYRGKTIRLSDGSPLSFDKLANMRWTVNGAAYDCSLNDVIEQARRRLKPESGISIIGHGDAHNGNIFVAGEPGAEELKLLMFDPAFAGRHDPILDLTKPLFHNIFARWM